MSVVNNNIVIIRLRYNNDYVNDSEHDSDNDCDILLGEVLTMELDMQYTRTDGAISYNLVVDVIGREFPNEVRMLPKYKCVIYVHYISDTRIL